MSDHDDDLVIPGLEEDMDEFGIKKKSHDEFGDDDLGFGEDDDLGLGDLAFPVDDESGF